MKIYQLETAKEFSKKYLDELNVEKLMQAYAEHVAKKFAAECVNESLGNKMEVSNMLHSKINSKYKSIIWDNDEL